MALGAIALGLLAGCGSSDQTGAAATCLRSALAQEALGGAAGGSCADSSALKAAGGQVPSVTCTHQNGNQYICHTAAKSFDAFNLANQFYAVTYDGKSIVWQRTQ